jgi:uncharacterized protein (DUF2236 family)
MKNLSSITVEGEPVEALISVLRRFEMDDPDDEDMVHLHATYPMDIGRPFHRALMRIEAELLLADADAVGSAGFEDRTPGQRRHDALIELLRRVNEAVASA